jgi:hypothetical protein
MAGKLRAGHVPIEFSDDRYTRCIIIEPQGGDQDIFSNSPQPSPNTSPVIC